MRLPLEGIRILDMSHMLPGPFCTMLLADMGAEVIKIERPGVGDSFRHRPPLIDGEGSAFLLLNRGKKSCALDLGQEADRERFMELARSADVLLEQFRPGVVQRLGIDYQSLKKLNPALIYCSMSGYGQTGPYRDMPGHDVNYLSLSGVLDGIGKKGETPSLAGVQIADINGAQWAVIAILLALMARGGSGEGQYIDLSIADCMLPALSLFLSDYAATGSSPSRGETKSSGAYAYYNVYETADGGFVSLGAAEPKFWENFCRLTGHEEWIALQMAEGEAGQELIAQLRSMFLTRTRDQWRELLEDGDCCFTPVLSAAEALRDRHFRSRGMIAELTLPGGRQVMNLAFPLKFSGMSPVEPTSPPACGQDNAELFESKT